MSEFIDIALCISYFLLGFVGAKVLRNYLIKRRQSG